MENQQSEKKESEWENILTIIFLALIPLAGLILMWFLADWSRKTKKIITLVLGIPVVVAILGVLTSITLVSLGGAREKARDAMRESDLRSIQVSLDYYYFENNVYPASLEDLKLVFGGAAPKDPLTNLSYEYALQPDGRDYLICANFEKKEKQKADCVDSQGAWFAK
ncbi:MAG: hypothetical protein V1705_02425 [bacterium]